MSTSRLVLAIAAVGLVASLSGGCSCSADIEESGSIGKKDGKTQVNCVCELVIGKLCAVIAGSSQNVTIPMEVCLPPNLNTALGGAQNMTDEEWGTQVREFCEVTTLENVSRFIEFLSPKGFCEQNCKEDLKCRLQAYPNGESTQANPETCGRQCESVECTSAICDNEKVIDGDGNYHPEECKCTVAGRCGGPSGVICRKPRLSRPLNRLRKRRTIACRLPTVDS